ncbi:CCD42-like protein [Mya arenaria]|uniref:CCD42-like protein n=1 Tax=Mya arenaria TaxID=6604 RepID=A0ABY7FFZ6_MYAAR|nr:CCD42-like protein [Mya arenaria]
MAETVLDRQKLFELDLDNQKKNVFVTQLHDREDEDDITAFPVVKETGDKLIETGINTLQRTLLLKKEVEVDRRRRAIQKYQTEVKLKEQKTVEMEQLQDELEVLKDTMLRLDKKVKQYKKFEDYLLRVIDVMPEDYLAASDDKMKGLMSRHRTLSDSNIHLVNKLEAMTDELEELKSNLDGMKNEHNKQVISINSELSRLQQVQEVESADNQKMENHYNATKGGLRQKRTELGVIMMAIDNIAEICHKRLDVPVIEMSLEQKLKKIMDYVNDRADVALMAQPDSDDESRSGSRRGSVDNSKRSKTKKKVTLNG